MLERQELNSLKLYAQQLYFDRFTVHRDEKIDEVRKASALIDRLSSDYENLDAVHQQYYNLVCIAAGLYYDFRERNTLMTKRYFGDKNVVAAIQKAMADNKTQESNGIKVSDGSDIDLAETWNYIILAKILHEREDQEATIITHLQHFVYLKEKYQDATLDTQNKIVLAQAFLNRYYAIIKYNASIALGVDPAMREEYTRQAQTILEDVLKVENTNAALASLISLDKAEVWHLLAVILINQNKLDDAKAALEKAAENWRIFNEHINRVHPSTYITKQVQAELLRLQAMRFEHEFDRQAKPFEKNLQSHGKYAEALVLLKSIVEPQKNLADNESHNDVAHTYWLMGKIYEDYDKQLLLALNYYEEAQKFAPTDVRKFEEAIRHVKIKIEEATVSNDDFIEQLAAFPRFNWNKPETFAVYAQEVNNIEVLIKKINVNKNCLKPTEKYEFARHVYQLGTFYSHMLQQPEEVILYQQWVIELLSENNAANTLAANELLEWAQLHIALAHLQRMFEGLRNKNVTEIEISEDLGKKYYEEIITKYEPINLISNSEILILEFALYIKAQFEHYEQKNYTLAVTHYEKALRPSENILNYDTLYYRIKADYTFAKLELEPDSKQTLAAIFNSIEKYWVDLNNQDNPYVARFYEIIAKFYQRCAELSADIYVRTQYYGLAVEKMERAIQLLAGKEHTNDIKLKKYLEVEIAEIHKIINPSPASPLRSLSFSAPLPRRQIIDDIASNDNSHAPNLQITLTRPS